MKTTAPYLDPTRPIEERVTDLIAHMSLDEKISQMTSRAAAIPRLGIQEYGYDGEASHGLVHRGRVSVFPHAIATAATWDSGLVQRIAEAISDEARAKYHEVIRKDGFAPIHQGLTFWTPCINLFRDPRWGRGQETYGEDPYLTGTLGTAFVRGMQGDDPRYLKTAACAKHFAAHSGPEAIRYEYNVEVSPRDLEETYLPAFKKLVMEAKVESVMPAYTRLNGEPCCGSPYLLGEILRGQWGFRGHVVSDCGAIGNFYLFHHVTADGAESAALGIKAGCDLECGNTYEYLGEAVQRGLITEAEIDRCLMRSLRTRFRLGMFDPPEMVPYSHVPFSVVASDHHHQLAYEGAVKSVVLLKNRGAVLPLSESLRYIHIVGPTAADVNCLLGNYHAMSDHLSSLLEGIVGAAPPWSRVMYHPGLTLTEKSARTDAHIDAMKSAEVVIACFGLSPVLEGEHGDPPYSVDMGDRRDLRLPAAQRDFLAKLADTGVPIVLVLTGGSPIVLEGLEDRMQAILYVWYPGMEGGRAVGDILFGKASPSGKLPITFPRSVDHLPPFEDYSMENRTYRFSHEEPLYPFGFGLGYTRFALSDLKLEQSTLTAGEDCIVNCTLTNIGPTVGDEVVQVYLRDVESSTRVPLQQLVAFQRVTVQPGETALLHFAISSDQMTLVDEDGTRRLEAGEFEIIIGNCLPGQRGQELGVIAPLTTRFWVRNKQD
jgi:beta-glucosidase